MNVNRGRAKCCILLPFPWSGSFVSASSSPGNGKSELWISEFRIRQCPVSVAEIPELRSSTTPQLWRSATRHSPNSTRSDHVVRRLPRPDPLPFRRCAAYAMIHVSDPSSGSHRGEVVLSTWPLPSAPL
jgi:hypothetical protein